MGDNNFIPIILDYIMMIDDIRARVGTSPIQKDVLFSIIHYSLLYFDINRVGMSIAYLPVFV